jgi:hypothetical protein
MVDRDEIYLELESRALARERTFGPSKTYAEEINDLIFELRKIAEEAEVRAKHAT